MRWQDEMGKQGADRQDRICGELSGSPHLPCMHAYSNIICCHCSPVYIKLQDRWQNIPKYYRCCQCSAGNRVIWTINKCLQSSPYSMLIERRIYGRQLIPSAALEGCVVCGKVVVERVPFCKVVLQLPLARRPGLPHSPVRRLLPCRSSTLQSAPAARACSCLLCGTPGSESCSPRAGRRRTQPSPCRPGSSAPLAAGSSYAAKDRVMQSFFRVFQRLPQQTRHATRIHQSIGMPGIASKQTWHGFVLGGMSWPSAIRTLKHPDVHRGLEPSMTNVQSSVRTCSG